MRDSKYNFNINFSFFGIQARPVMLFEVMAACMRVSSVQTSTAPPMRLSEVQTYITWESLQTAGPELTAVFL